MRGHFNVNGFNIFLSYEMGFPYGVDFSRGYPRYMIGETTTIDLLNRKEADLFMVIAADPGAHFPAGANMHLVDIPRNPDRYTLGTHHRAGRYCTAWNLHWFGNPRNQLSNGFSSNSHEKGHRST